MGNPKFVIQRSSDQFYFHLAAGNGEIILTSERYTTKAAAENGVTAVKESATIDRRYDRRVSTNDKPYFVLKAGNNEIVGTSQMYASREARDGGMQSVRANTPIAGVEG
jgi:uncharacterized protein YegP (UPF0339 family)